MGVSILVADDEPHIAALLRAALGGHDVVVAYDGQEALDEILRLQPAVVLLDGDMPRLDGYEVAARVRAAEGIVQPFIAMLTAAGRETDRERALGAGVDEFLTKPFSPSALRRRIEEILSERGEA